MPPQPAYPNRAFQCEDALVGVGLGEAELFEPWEKGPLPATSGLRWAQTAFVASLWTET